MRPTKVQRENHLGQIRHEIKSIERDIFEAEKYCADAELDRLNKELKLLKDAETILVERISVMS